MLELSEGQRLALAQLEEIVANSQGTLEFVETVKSQAKGYILVYLSLETSGYRSAGGLAFRDREPIKVVIPPSFPFSVPALHFRHKRFIGTPHVQWGTYICLYQSSETEYQPADGMFGFFDRIDWWMRAAGKGELDPEDAALHPPAVYTASSTVFVAREDAPDNDAIWIGRADLRKMGSGRFDIVGWTRLTDWGDLPDHPVAAAILFDKPLAAEYPSQVSDLIDLIEKAGLEFGTLYSLLKIFSLVGSEEEPAYFVIGAPMRRKAAGAPLRAHLTVWEIGPDALKALRAIVLSGGEDALARDKLVDWMVKSSVSWCTVLEDRPEIVNRRDSGSLLGYLKGKRILLLGCGALGSAVAEMVVRAGAAKLHLVDSGIVKPGLLVRQRYTDADVGSPKANALKERLQAIGLQCGVTADAINIANAALTRFDLKDWDLIIDATASASVAHRMEEELKSLTLPIPMVSMSVSAAAENGSVLVKMPGYRGGPHQIARQAKIEAFAKNAAEPLVKAFWPARETIKVFQPEPGCSMPTFVGSVADIDHHAAGLLNLGVHRVKSLAFDAASMDLVAAPWLPGNDRRRDHLHYALKEYARHREQNHRYAVLRSDAAALDMAGELKRIARTRSNKIETGGLIFGEVDEAHQVIWIDGLSGPPPDSIASEAQFLCGTAGTKELNAFKMEASDRSTRFIGIWHTHPVSRGQPSQEDMIAALALLHLQESSPRHIVMLIVGHAATRTEENYYLFCRNEFVLISHHGAGEGDPK